MISKLKNIILLAAKNTLTDFSQSYPSNQVSWFGKTGRVVAIFPYGTRSQAPVESQMLKLNIGADESNRVGIEFNTSNLPTDEMPEGEYECGNFVTGSSIRFYEDGSIKITSVDALNVVVEGNINITCEGDLSVNSTGTADITASDVTVNASNATLNATCAIGGSGGLPLARSGDSVLVNTTTGVGTITSGSGTHTAT